MYMFETQIAGLTLLFLFSYKVRYVYTGHLSISRM